MEKAKTDGRTDLGGDIMIHGKKVTIGCIPIGDKNIEEVFTLAAKSTNQRFPIIIAPTDFRKNKNSLLLNPLIGKMNYIPLFNSH